MEYTINVPDGLSKERVMQAIKQLEQSLREEAVLNSSQPQKRRRVYAHLFKVDDLSLPSREELYER